VRPAIACRDFLGGLSAHLSLCSSPLNLCRDGRNFWQAFFNSFAPSYNSLCVFLYISIRINTQTDRVINYLIGFLNPQVNMNYLDGYAISLGVLCTPSKNWNYPDGSCNNRQNKTGTVRVFRLSSSDTFKIH